MRIISDSSSNLQSVAGFSYTSVPLKVITAEKEYVDDRALDIGAMLDELKTVKGKTHTSCPNVQEWKSAIGDENEAFVITITGALSGSYNAAVQAAKELREENAGRRICVIDSLSTGPEMQLLIERIAALAGEGKSFDEIEREIRRYHRHTHLLFALQRMDNLARNGRINSLVARMAGVLGIHAVGEASPAGTLQMLHKARGRQKTVNFILAEMERQGYRGGRVSIAHCRNEVIAAALRLGVLAAYPNAEVTVLPTTALCSYYAEDGGVLVGYEDEGVNA